jgi:hypothetical protein
MFGSSDRRSRIGYVKRYGLTAKVPCGFAGRLGIPVGDDHFCTGFGKHRRHRSADPRRTAGDDSYPAGKVELPEHHFSCPKTDLSAG